MADSTQLAYIVGHAFCQLHSGHQAKKREQSIPARFPFGSDALRATENSELTALGSGARYRDKEKVEADRISLTLMRVERNWE